MGTLVINFDSYLTSITLQKKICIPAVLVDIIKMVLRIQVSSLFRAKGITEQFNKQILLDAAGGGMLDSHGRYLISL